MESTFTYSITEVLSFSNFETETSDKALEAIVGCDFFNYKQWITIQSSKKKLHIQLALYLCKILVTETLPRYGKSANFWYPTE